MKVSTNFNINLFLKAKKFSDSVASSKHCRTYYVAGDIFLRFISFKPYEYDGGPEWAFC
jgi:hypothetical protein